VKVRQAKVLTSSKSVGSIVTPFKHQTSVAILPQKDDVAADEVLAKLPRNATELLAFKEEARKPLLIEIEMLQKQIVQLQEGKPTSGHLYQNVVESDSDAELEDKNMLEDNDREGDVSVVDPVSKETRKREAHIRKQASKMLDIRADQPVYVGKAAHLRKMMLQGVLYLDAGSTGTRPQIFVYGPERQSLSEFWMLSRSKEIQNIRLHECLESEYSNDELLKKLKGGSDSDRIKLFENVRLNDTFIDYVKNTIHHLSRIVNRWMQKERAENGVIFWQDGPATLFTDILIPITGGLRAVVGQSPELLEKVNAHLTSYLVKQLDDAHVLNAVNLTVELLRGEDEAMCEASAVSVLSSMDSKASGPGAVVSMGGATVQISAKDDGTIAFVSVPVARKMAWSAAERQLGGTDNTALDAYETAYKTAVEETLSEHPMLLKEPRRWNAVSGLFFVAKDNGFEINVDHPVEEVVSSFRAKLPTLLESGASAKEVGSAVAAMTVLSHLKGSVTFQRQWLNPTTNQKLNGNVSTGYVLRRLGFTDDT
jgi:hypothetical protein